MSRNPAPLSSGGVGSDGVGNRRRKKRTSIDATIRVALEKSFQSNSKPTSEDITLIADSLNMEKEVIRVWFCNRRQKEKRINPPSSSLEFAKLVTTTNNNSASIPTLTPITTSDAKSDAVSLTANQQEHLQQLLNEHHQNQHAQARLQQAQQRLQQQLLSTKQESLTTSQSDEDCNLSSSSSGISAGNIFITSIRNKAGLNSLPSGGLLSQNNEPVAATVTATSTSLSSISNGSLLFPASLLTSDSSSAASTSSSPSTLSALSSSLVLTSTPSAFSPSAAAVLQAQKSLRLSHASTAAGPLMSLKLDSQNPQQLTLLPTTSGGLLKTVGGIPVTSTSPFTLLSHLPPLNGNL